MSHQSDLNLISVRPRQSYRNIKRVFWILFETSGRAKTTLFAFLTHRTLHWAAGCLSNVQ